MIYNYDNYVIINVSMNFYPIRIPTEFLHRRKLPRSSAPSRPVTRRDAGFGGTKKRWENHRKTMGQW